METFSCESDLEELSPLFYTDILLVEDDSVTSSLIKSSIERCVDKPLRIRSVASAEKAAEHILSLKKHHLPGPDFAIIDYMLSGKIDGLRLCKMIGQHFPETQTFLMSTSSLEIIKEKMQQMHFKTFFINKPFEVSELLDLLDE